MTSWHTEKLDKIYKELKSSEAGLTKHEAEARLRFYGRNTLDEQKKYSWLLILSSQFASAMVLVLVGAMLISFFMGHNLDACIIGGIIVINAVFGFIQEYKAERSIEALKKLAAPSARAIRDGKEVTISAEELVPGDVILLEAGNVIPADARLIEVVNLQMDEAVLTGESRPTAKLIGESEHKYNLVYSGTSVLNGHALAIVFATGMATEFGRIAKLVATTKDDGTPLQGKLAVAAKYIGLFVTGICGVIFLVGVLQGTKLFDMFLNSVALAVAAVPEGLPAVVTITLAIGMKAMAKRKAIVRRLPVTETLGSATVICSDKTGTLTKNEMTVTQLFSDGKIIEVTGSGYDTSGKFIYNDKNYDVTKSKTFTKLFEIADLCNTTKIEKGKVIGDPTEAALIVAARKAKIDLHGQYKQVGEISFNSERKMMTTVHRTNRYIVASVKGATEIILKRCTHILMNGVVRKITSSDREKILLIKHEMSQNALRVLALAYRQLREEDTKKITSEHIEKELVFVGLAGMIDPPRPEVHKAIAVCKQAGIKIIMVTGDDRDTALAVAKNTGLYDGGEIVLGDAVDKMSARELEKLVEDVTIFARATSEHKIRIVEALRKNGHVIAMTGDGVNDAPALKAADIGVAMGIKGTDVAKGASDIVLEDDNFATIVSAVEEGRTIYDNIRKFILFLLSSNFGEVLVIFMASLLGFPLPLIAVQLLLGNLLTDGFPALALGVDPPAQDLMSQKPRSPKLNIIDKVMIRKTILVGLTMCIGTLILFKLALSASHSEAYARTVALTVLVGYQMVNVFNVRSNTQSVFKNAMPSPWLIVAIASSMAVQLAVNYLPFLQNLFSTAAISVGWLALCGAVAMSSLAVIEVEKLIVRNSQKFKTKTM